MNRKLKKKKNRYGNRSRKLNCTETFCGCKASSEYKGRVVKQKEKNKTSKNDKVATRLCAMYKRQTTRGWALFGLTIFFNFIFMVVGTQDKGHKVSNVQVMPLSLGALPSEKVPRCQTAAYTGGLRGKIHVET